CVYNGRNRVPYDLPANKTRSTFRTKTHKGRGFNELRFEDERGREEVFSHATRDHNQVVRRDLFSSVHRSQFSDIGGEMFQRVGRSFALEAQGTVEVASQMGTVISSGPIGMSPFRFKPIIKNESAEVDRVKVEMASIKSAFPTGGLTLRAQTVLLEEVGLSRISMAGTTMREVAGKAKTTHAGELVRTSSGSTIVNEAADVFSVVAGEVFEAVVGGSSIRMAADGTIEISGSHIKLSADRIDMK
ncbi:hypothetical protein BYZ73_19910, partial [Rhodovulum viride]